MRIKLLGICGSPIKGGNAEAFLKEALRTAQADDTVGVELVTLADKEIRGCRHCNWCLRKQEDGRFCRQRDDMSEIYPKLLGADGILIATPVYFARLSGHLANFLDRLRVFVEGNRYGKSLEDKVGGALAVGWFRNSGVETALLTILYAYFVLGMIPVGPDSQWGASGLSSEGGTGKFVPGDKLGVLKDEYGLQAAQMLAGRVVKIAKLLKAGVAR